MNKPVRDLHALCERAESARVQCESLRIVAQAMKEQGELSEFCSAPNYLDAVDMLLRQVWAGFHNQAKENEAKNNAHKEFLEVQGRA